MSTPSTFPPPPVVPPPPRFSLAEYRAHNDRLEAKYGPTASASRPLVQAKEHLRRSRRAGGRTEVAVDEVQSALAAVIDALAGKPAAGRR